ncbi:efflux RND transporter periplasmic adaptor subunit [Nostocoides sp. HKS02]|uniref:efflux RND transporter periplasmic adaptor subunit n=1 Tax=Nostocoides sp. HKS02 TaxID=1813880 RepID=UPI0018A7EA09|nr:HlyD family efflux transporter periplasmic adaptor subunit [Tetrasphaera sp. HKS02]
MAAVAAAVVAAAAGGWALARPTTSAATTTSITTTATTGTIRQTVSASGTLAPARRADLSFAVSGTVTAVPVAVGDKVTKGATLATLRNDALQSAVDTAQAGVTAAQDQVNAGSSTAAAAASAQAQLAAAQSTLSRAQQQLAAATLTSPISGVVAAVGVGVGDIVGSGSTGSGSTGSGGSGSGGSGSGGSGSGGSGSGGSGSSGASSSSSAQFTVISTNAWVVDASVAAADLAQVRKGLQVQISVDGSSQQIFGTVSSVGVMASAGSSGTATFPVVVTVTGSPAGLYAGATVTAAIVVKQLTNVLTVPSAAVSSDANGPYVTVVKNGIQTRTPVVLGTVFGGVTQITTGLSDGAQVLVRQIRLPQGTTGGTGRQRTGGFGGGFGGGGGGFGGGGGGFGGGGGQGGAAPSGAATP